MDKSKGETKIEYPSLDVKETGRIEGKDAGPWKDFLGIAGQGDASIVVRGGMSCFAIKRWKREKRD
jgi:hypothetical protein